MPQDLNLPSQPANNVGYVPPVESTTTQEIPSTPKGNSGVSTLQPSSSQQIRDAIDASFPIMAVPLVFHFLGGSDEKGFSIEQKAALNQSDTILAMLDKWGESLKEEADAAKRKDKNPDEIRRTEERRARANLLDAMTIAIRMPNVSSEAVTALDANKTPESIKAFAAVVTLGLIFSGSGGAREVMMTNETAVGIAPSVDGPAARSPYTGDMRAELGLLGAAMMQGARYLANTQSVLGTKAVDEAEAPVETAKNYAKNILSLVNSGQLTNFINAIITVKTEPGQPPDPKLVSQAKALEVQLKITLLASALAALYISEKEGGTGGISKEEFQGLLDGSLESFGPNKEDMDSLIAQINKLFTDPNLDEKSASALNKGLSDFLGSSPTLATLTDPSKVFSNLMPYIRPSSSVISA